MKGAASVLVNAYMKNPTLSQEKANFASAVGYLGQLSNDIEGISEDLEEGRFTPVTMSYIKHGHIDKFVFRMLAHIDQLKLEIPKKFPNLSQNKITMLLNLCQFHTIARTVYAHQQNKNGILSKNCLKKIEKEFGFKIDILALGAKLEYETFGGLMIQGKADEDLEEKLSDPNKLRDLIIKFLIDVRDCSIF